MKTIRYPAVISDISLATGLISLTASHHLNFIELSDSEIIMFQVLVSILNVPSSKSLLGVSYVEIPSVTYSIFIIARVQCYDDLRKLGKYYKV